jgi:hypothetical protein
MYVDISMQNFPFLFKVLHYLSLSNGGLSSSFNQLLLFAFVTLPDKHGSDSLSHHQCPITSVRVTTLIESSWFKDDTNYHKLLMNICKIKWTSAYLM